MGDYNAGQQPCPKYTEHEESREWWGGAGASVPRLRGAADVLRHVHSRPSRWRLGDVQAGCLRGGESMSVYRGNGPDPRCVMARAEDMLQEVYEAGRQAERAAVVAWLRTGAQYPSVVDIIGELERGDHVGE
jgi:hypothetical protein